MDDGSPCPRRGQGESLKPALRARTLGLAGASRRGPNPEPCTRVHAVPELLARAVFLVCNRTVDCGVNGEENTMEHPITQA